MHKHSRCHSLLTLSLLLAFLLVSSRTAAALPPFTVIALSGQQAPDMSPGTTIHSFGAGVITSTGHLGFSAGISNADGQSLGRGYFTGFPANLRSAFLSGQPAPGIDGGTLVSWHRVRPNGAGHLATQHTFFSPSGNGAGIWAGPAGDLTLVARHGGQAPDLPAGVLLNMNESYLRLTHGDGGHAVFDARLSGPGVTLFDDSAIFSAIGGHTRLIAREGMTHPELGPDRAIGHLGYIKVVAPRVNATGAVAFSTYLAGDDVPVGTEHAMFRADTTGLYLVAKTGQPIAIPGVPNAYLGRFMHGLKDGLINNAGQIAFGTHLTGDGITSLNDEAIVVAQPGGGLSILAREGDPVPDAPGHRFGVFTDLRFGGGGHAVFRALLRDDSGFSNFAIIVASAQGIQTAFALNQPNPGLPEGYTMGVPALDSMAANARGQIIFLGSASSTLPDQPSLYGLWAFDPIAGLFPVALAGDLIEVAPGDTRTVSSAGIVYQELEGNSGGQDGFAGNLNDLGQVIFRANFTDGTQAIVTTTIPTPATAAILGITAASLASRRRRAPEILARPLARLRPSTSASWPMEPPTPSIRKLT